MPHPRLLRLSAIYTVAMLAWFALRAGGSDHMPVLATLRLDQRGASSSTSVASSAK